MMFLKDAQKDAIKQLFLDKVVKYCDKCGTKYTKDDVKILQAFGPSTIIQITCHNCKARYIVHFNFETQAESKVPIAAEVVPFQIITYNAWGPINTDDVLKMYKVLTRSKNLDDFFEKVEDDMSAQGGIATAIESGQNSDE